MPRCSFKTDSSYCPAWFQARSVKQKEILTLPMFYRIFLWMQPSATFVFLDCFALLILRQLIISPELTSFPWFLQLMWWYSPFLSSTAASSEHPQLCIGCLMLLSAFKDPFCYRKEDWTKHQKKSMTAYPQKSILRMVKSKFLNVKLLLLVSSYFPLKVPVLDLV